MQTRRQNLTSHIYMRRYNITMNSELSKVNICMIDEYINTLISGSLSAATNKGRFHGKQNLLNKTLRLRIWRAIRKTR